MTKLGRAVAVLGLAAGLFAGRPARADLPPPPGMNKVQYAFRVTGASPGVVLVALPLPSPQAGAATVLTPDKDVTLYQGYMPSIYSLPAADAAELAGKSQEDLDKLLASRGHRCVEKVPRVYQVPSETQIRAMIDVIKVDATATDCRASLLETIYRGDAGLEGKGGVDASGNRTPPSPFTNVNLAPVTGLLASSASPTASPTTSPAATGAPDSPPPNNPPSDAPPPAAPSGTGGCAGCATPVAPVAGGGVLAILALGTLAMRRKSRGPRAGQPRSDKPSGRPE